MKIYNVGGSVRDELLGVKTKDRDFVVVGSTPEEMLSLGFKQVGAAFPVFLKDGEEYALARTEKKIGNGYHGFETNFDPSVTLEQDLFRRDLTINAMARDMETGVLIDPFNGLSDLYNKTLRHVSEHFAEDPVRILRVARFAGRDKDFIIHPDTMLLMKQLVASEELAHVTSERIWLEFEKALVQPYPSIFINVLHKCGAIDKLFPTVTKFHKDILSDIDYSKHVLELDEVMALMLLWNDYYDMLSILHTLKVPNHIEKFCINVHKAYIWANSHHTHEDTVSLLNDIGAFKDSQLLPKIVRATIFDNESYCYLLNCYHLVKNISFSDLTDEQKTKLKGPEISKAIAKLRVEVLEINSKH